jgi:Ca2+-transporting ATPase
MTVLAGTFGFTSFVHANAISEKHQTIAPWASATKPAAKQLIIHSVAINSTAFEGEEYDKPAFVGSKTETTLLPLTRDHLGPATLSETRENEQVAHMCPFGSSKKCTGAVVKLPDGSYQLVVKDASEILLGFASTFTHFDTLENEPLFDDRCQVLTDTINEYANRSLMTIGSMYCDFQQ